MSAFDKYPLGKPAFVTHILDRAAHLRTNDEKLFALESQRNAGAYVIYRDSLLVKQETDGPRVLLGVEEAVKLGANPGTIFLGLRDGAPVFGMGISATAVEKLITRDDVAVTELRGMAMQGTVPPEQLSAIAMAKSMVTWHQRHGFCANCGTRTGMKEGGWKRECPNCKAEHFPRTDPVVIMLVTSRREMSARPAEAVHARDVVVSGRLCRSGGDHRGRGPPRDFRGIRHPLHRRELLHDAAMALSVIADDRMRRARTQRGYRG